MATGSRATIGWMADRTLTNAGRRDASGIVDRTATASTTLEAWSQHNWSNGVQIETLPALVALDVRTRNTDYRIVIIDGQRGDVLITGGRFFPTATRARLNGCSLGGSCLKWRGLYCGFRIELQVDGETIITTRVKSIAVLSNTPGPTDSVH